MIKRFNNDDVEFYIDNGNGYEQITLTMSPSSASLNDNINTIRINLAKNSWHTPLLKNEHDWVGFCGDFNNSGYYITDTFDINNHCLWDTIALSTSETDRNHYITTTVLNGNSEQAINGFIDLRGDFIDISTIRVAEHPSLKLQFNFHGNGSTTPELYGWKIHSTPVIYDNIFMSNINCGIFCDWSNPSIQNNEMNSNYVGIHYNSSPIMMVISEDHRETYEMSYIDHFLSHGRLSEWDEVTIINDQCILKNGSYQGTIISENITLSESYRWNRLVIRHQIPTDSFINLSIIDPDTGLAIEGFENLSFYNISLMGLDPSEYPTIQVKAYFARCSGIAEYPKLLEWSIITKMHTGFLDYFNDDDYIDSAHNVVMDNGSIRLKNRTWWNNDYNYRRNITYSDDLGINRTNEEHDFHINFSTWSNKPQNSVEIKLISPNGTIIDREITEFESDYYVNFTIKIINLSALSLKKPAPSVVVVANSYID